MTNMPATTQKEETSITPEDNTKRIENHKQTAKHLEEAAKFHNEAAKFHTEKNHEKAAQSTIKAHGHNAMANELQREDIKRHAMTK